MQEANKLRHSLRDLSAEREILRKTLRVRVTHVKKETDRRGVARRQKACPEYWEDHGDHDDDTEETSEDRVDAAIEEAEREDYETEYTNELEVQEEEQWELELEDDDEPAVAEA